MKRTLTRIGIVAAALASVLPGAADAATLTVEDAVGDTWTTDYSQDGTVTDVPTGGQVNVDIAKTVIRYSSGRLKVKATYVDLDRSTNRFQLGLRLRTNEGLKRLAVVDAAVSQNWDGVHALGKLNGDELKCAGLSHAIDYDANTVSVGQPTFTHDNGLSGGTEHAGWTGRVRAG